MTVRERYSRPNGANKATGPWLIPRQRGFASRRPLTVLRNFSPCAEEEDEDPRLRSPKWTTRRMSRTAMRKGRPTIRRPNLPAPNRVSTSKAALRPPPNPSGNHAVKQDRKRNHAGSAGFVPTANHALTTPGLKNDRIEYGCRCHNLSREDPSAVRALRLDSSAGEVAPGWREAGGLPRARDRSGG